MKFLLEMVDWVIRTKAQGEQFDNSKSAEKFKWFSVILEFIQNAIDSNLLFNRLKKKNNSNHKDVPVIIKISFKKISFPNFVKNFLTKKFKAVLALSRFKPNAAKELEGEDQVETLILEDFNTTGILGDHTKYSPKLDDGKDNPIFRFNFFVGDDEKMNDPELGGSEGEGRQTFYFASKISTFFYYTVRQDLKPLIYGMTFIGKNSNPDDIHQPWVNVLRFGKKEPLVGKTPDGKVLDLSYAVPIANDECNDIFRSIVPIKRKNETGTSVVIPYYERRNLKKDKVILKIIDVYRVQILRDHLIVEIDGETIDSKTIDQIYKKYTHDEDLEKLNKLNYLNFIRQIDNEVSTKSFEINYSRGLNLYNEGAVSNLNELIDFYNDGKVVKLKCNFVLNSERNVPGQYRPKEISLNTYFDLYLKKTDGAYSSKNCNDFIRGEMSIYAERKRLNAFALLDVQDKEAKLFFKCAEGANHSIWEPNNWKLENGGYYTETYSDVVKFAKKIPEQILRLIESKDVKPDYDALSELFPDLSDEGKQKKQKKKKKKKQEDVTPPFVPKIYPRIKNYEITPSQHKEGGFNVKGILHEKNEIVNQLKNMKEEKKKSFEFMEKEENTKKKEIMLEDLRTLEKRIDHYEKFINDGCDNFPITIEFKMGFEGEGLANPIKSWSQKHFDLDKNKEFKFDIDGDASIKKRSGNTLHLSAKSGNFKFSLKGFHKISDYDVAIKDKEI